MSASSKLDIIDYARLRKSDKTEAQHLTNVCEKGIFLLDLRQYNIQKLQDDLRVVDDAQRSFFSRDLKTKIRYATSVPDQGYERFEELNVDMIEFPQKEQLDHSWDLPDDFRNCEDSLVSLMNASDTILRNLLDILSKSSALGLPENIAGDSKAPGKSNFGLAIAKAAPGTPLTEEHADDGLLTLLYHITPFVDVKDDAGKWYTVPMVDGFHIVNVGSALEQLSGGKLKAAEHRVVQVPGENHLLTYYLHAAEPAVRDESC